MDIKDTNPIVKPKENEGAALPPIVEGYYDLCRWILEKGSKSRKELI